jgi:hypothetical protein
VLCICGPNRRAYDAVIRPTKRPTRSNAMPDFLTRRCGTWHFVRRVSAELRRLVAQPCHD